MSKQQATEALIPQWKPIQYKSDPEDPDEFTIEFQQLRIGEWSLEVMELENRQWAGEVLLCDGSVVERTLDEEDDVKRALLAWLVAELQTQLTQATDALNACGGPPQSPTGKAA